MLPKCLYNHPNVEVASTSFDGHIILLVLLSGNHVAFAFCLPKENGGLSLQKAHLAADFQTFNKW